MSQTSSPAKTTARKAAQKRPGKPDPSKTGKDLRRSFEHLGRVKVLTSFSTANDTVQVLVRMAESAIQGQLYKEGADLLRAAEHCAFGGLLRTDRDAVAPEIVDELEREIKHLSERAREHGAAADRSEAIQGVSRECSRRAKAAAEERAFRAALEYSRAAEALAHVGGLNFAALSSPARLRAVS